MNETEPTFDDVLAAAERIAGRAVETPLLESAALNERVGGRILLKAEPLQITGSFKFRGAYNRISQIPEAERAVGVVAFSSGNHAQGVAAAAHLLGAPAIIVMPENAPRAKREGTERWGAEIVTYDPRDHDSRERIAAEILAARGGTLVRPFDDPLIVAGQGTVGLEIGRRAELLGIALDAVLVPCGGGALTAGTATALEALSPATKVYTVEPEGFDDTARSLVSGEREHIDENASSFCDGLLAPRPGVVTLPLNRRLVTAGLSIADDAVGDAMLAAFQHFKLVIEPSGAIALAAALTGGYDCRDKTVAIVASGGNVDAGKYAEVLRRAG